VKVVALLNEVDTSRLPRLLSRLLHKLPHKREAAFSEEETQQLCELLNLTAEDLQLLLDGSSYIFEEGAYTSVPPAKLGTELVEAGVEHERAEVFAAVWRDGADAYIHQCKVNSVLSPQHLSGIDWQLAIQTADSSGARSQQGLALLELHLTSDRPAVRFVFEV